MNARSATEVGIDGWGSTALSGRAIDSRHLFFLFSCSSPFPPPHYPLSLGQGYQRNLYIGSLAGHQSIKSINTGGSPQPPHSKPLGGLQPRDSGAIVSKTLLKQARNKNAIEAAILNRVLDRD